ncbi:MAG: thioredoxin domain-containing protein [Thermomicrobiales bacterium]
MTDHPTLTIPVGPQDHRQGPESAPVTLVEYGDYECPYCGQAYPILKRLLQELGDSVQFVFRNFPISTSHPNAELAAEAAEAADAQGQFWPMHDLLYENQQHLGPEQILALANRLGLDMQRFENDLLQRRFEERVRTDFMGGVRSGVNGTPTFFINGVRFDGDWTGDGLSVTISRMIGRH